mmetsp:Transcript_10147/g.19664  ORF Transcript_10147/g.19664 Transcript_10147/m.19664 type:complete len:82 (-) Transcript_10147:170-415(-)
MHIIIWAIPYPFVFLHALMGLWKPGSDEPTPDTKKALVKAGVGRVLCAALSDPELLNYRPLKGRQCDIQISIEQKVLCDAC